MTYFAVARAGARTVAAPLGRVVTRSRQKIARLFKQTVDLATARIVPARDAAAARAFYDAVMPAPRVARRKRKARVTGRRRRRAALTPKRHRRTMKRAVARRAPLKRIHARRRRATVVRNPTLAILGGNPPRRRRPRAASVPLGRATQLEYVHSNDGRRYYHRFGSGVRVALQKDGSVTIRHPQRKLWKMFAAN